MQTPPLVNIQNTFEPDDSVFENEISIPRRISMDITKYSLYSLRNYL